MEGGSNDRKIDGGTSSEQSKKNNKNRGDVVSSSRPGAFSSSYTPIDRLRAKIGGGYDDRKIDVGTSSEQLRTSNENRGDGVSSPRPGAISSSSTPYDERRKAKMEGKLGVSNSGHVDGGSFSGQTRASEERQSDVVSSSIPGAIS